MADLPESPTWHPGILQWETDTPALGGALGPMNVPTRQLTDRTRWLRTYADQVIAAAAPHATLEQQVAAMLARLLTIEQHLGLLPTQDDMQLTTILVEPWDDLDAWTGDTGDFAVLDGQLHYTPNGDAASSLKRGPLDLISPIAAISALVTIPGTAGEWTALGQVQIGVGDGPGANDSTRCIGLRCNTGETPEVNVYRASSGTGLSIFATGPYVLPDVTSRLTNLQTANYCAAIIDAELIARTGQVASTGHVTQHLSVYGRRLPWVLGPLTVLEVPLAWPAGFP